MAGEIQVIYSDTNIDMDTSIKNGQFLIPTHPQQPKEWKLNLFLKKQSNSLERPKFQDPPPFNILPGGCYKYMVPLHIVLLYTIIATTSKHKTTDLVAYLNYVPPRTEKHFWLSLELLKRQCHKKDNIVKRRNNFFLLKWAGFMRACQAT